MSKSASVILPTRDKASYLRLTLASLLAQDRQDFEIVVVDDGSVDGTVKLLRQLKPRFPSLVLLRQPNLGRAAARNKALLHSQGDIVILLDDDHIVRPDFVSRHLEHHDRQGQVAVVGGIGHNIVTHSLPPAELRRDPAYSNPFKDPVFRKRAAACQTDWTPLILEKDLLQSFSWVESLAFPDATASSRIETAVSTFGTDLKDFHLPWLFFGAGNSSAPRESVLQVGCFNERFNGWGSEDLELGYRLYKQGLRFVVEPRTRSFHQVHHRNRAAIQADARRNQNLFLQIHEDFEILMFLRFDSTRYTGLNCPPIDILQYNRAVAAYYAGDQHSRDRSVQQLVAEIAECREERLT